VCCGDRLRDLASAAGSTVAGWLLTFSARLLRGTCSCCLARGSSGRPAACSLFVRWKWRVLSIPGADGFGGQNALPGVGGVVSRGPRRLAARPHAGCGLCRAVARGLALLRVVASPVLYLQGLPAGARRWPSPRRDGDREGRGGGEGRAFQARGRGRLPRDRGRTGRARASMGRPRATGHHLGRRARPRSGSSAWRAAWERRGVDLKEVRPRVF